MTAGERLAASVADLTQTRLDNADDASDARCLFELEEALARLPQSTTTFMLRRAAMNLVTQGGAA